MPIVNSYGSKRQYSVFKAQVSSLLTVPPILRSKPLRAPLQINHAHPMHLTIPETDLIIRQWCLDDAATAVCHANNPNVSAGLRDRFPYPYTPDDAKAFLVKAVEPDSTHFAIASEREGGAIGGIGYEPRSDVDRFTAELGYWLGEPFWGRGWMTRVVSVFSNWLLGPEAPQEFVRVEARIYDFNLASSRVLEKAGFQFEGRHRKAIFKRGRFADTLSYGRVNL
jgi:ribosomal-protein-alanine N-acetyltransferase